jgi:uncharacterized protein
MNVFDFNVHLTYSEEYKNSLGTQTSKAANSLNTESKMTIDDYSICLKEYRKDFNKSFTYGNFMFFNTEISQSKELTTVLDWIGKEYPESRFTALFDYRLEGYKKSLENLKNNGFDAIKFHPYSQEIETKDFDNIVKISKIAESLGFRILICTSFGTSKMHKHDGIGLACSLANYISKVPLVLLHSGGIRAYEALLLAEDKRNVYLDTSFSLNYLENSPIWDDLAFIYKKLGPERILYGSDFPYVSFEDSLACIDRFFSKYKFTSREKDQILSENSRSIFQS